MEKLVRPFQTDDISPPKRILSGIGTKSNERVILRIGRGGSGKSLSGSYSLRVSKYLDRNYAEKTPFATRGIPIDPRT